jgi:hypothetical protein
MEIGILRVRSNEPVEKVVLESLSPLLRSVSGSKRGCVVHLGVEDEE